MAALAPQRRAAGEAAEPALVDGGAAHAQEPSAARECARRLLLAIATMGRRDLAVAFLSRAQSETLRAAICAVRDEGLRGADEEAALASLAAALSY